MSSVDNRMRVTYAGLYEKKIANITKHKNEITFISPATYFPSYLHGEEVRAVLYLVSEAMKADLVLSSMTTETKKLSPTLLTLFETNYHSAIVRDISR